MVIQIMMVGEETGALDEMLEKIAESYDQEVEATVDALTSLIEPLLIAVMGVAVGGMVVALYTPMFNIINLIKQRARTCAEAAAPLGGVVLRSVSRMVGSCGSFIGV